MASSSRSRATPHGDSSPLTFTYDPDGAIAISLTPDHGPEAGGTSVTITGTDFTEATGVTFDGLAGTSFTVVNDTSITVSSAAHESGPVDVVVLSPAGNSSPLTFTYDPDAANAISLTPDHGPDTGGTSVTITGSDFTEATGVTFGGLAGSSFTVMNDTTITVVTPPHARGPVDVVVQSPAGDADPLTFTYEGRTRIDTIFPESGPETGGTGVTITGWCFTGADQVMFGSVPAAHFMIVNDTTMTAETPPHSPGWTEVMVVGADGCIGDPVPGGFTFLVVATTTTTSTTTPTTTAPTTTAPTTVPTTPAPSTTVPTPNPTIVLPETGSSPDRQLGWAGAVLVLGAGLLLTARRRTFARR
jgi:LPXTG-motif cell wall-anchored protein